MTTTDRIKATGISPDEMTHVMQLCNSVRLSEHDAELCKAAAHANGFVAGLQLGGGISEHQKEQLVELFDELVARTSEQLSITMDETKSGTCEPNFVSENQSFEKAAAEVGLQLDKLPGGFYVSQVTQHSWAFWIRRAAIAGIHGRLDG